MDKREGGKPAMAVRDIAIIGMMIAILEVSKRALDFLPNVELVTFWMILFTLFMGRKTIWAAFGFALIEGMIYGFHVWWVMYLYIWPLLVLLTWELRRMGSVILWSVVSALFGFGFGAACSIPYIVIGTVDGGVQNGLYAGFTWWVAGIPWDILHGISNFLIMLTLYVPVRRMMEKLKIKGNSSFV